MEMFEGKEELNDMSKSDTLEMMKEIIYPNRGRGGFVTLEGGVTVKSGQNMSKFTPIIDGNNYTWANLKQYPTPSLRILAYRLWQQMESEEE